MDTGIAAPIIDGDASLPLTLADMFKLKLGDCCCSHGCHDVLTPLSSALLCMDLLKVVCSIADAGDRQIPRS